jgi:hypothetical protein
MMALASAVAVSCPDKSMRLNKEISGNKLRTPVVKPTSPIGLATRGLVRAMLRLLQELFLT